MSVISKGFLISMSMKTYPNKGSYTLINMSLPIYPCVLLSVAKLFKLQYMTFADEQKSNMLKLLFTSTI